MNAYILRVLVIDLDELGAASVSDTIESTRYPNRCISPDVLSIDEHDIGEWSDEHPLNKIDVDVDDYLLDADGEILAGVIRTYLRREITFGRAVELAKEVSSRFTRDRVVAVLRRQGVEPHFDEEMVAEELAPNPVEHVPGADGELTPVYWLADGEPPIDLEWKDTPDGFGSKCEVELNGLVYQLNVSIQLDSYPAGVAWSVRATDLIGHGPTMQHSFPVNGVDGDAVVAAKSRAAEALRTYDRAIGLLWPKHARR